MKKINQNSGRDKETEIQYLSKDSFLHVFFNTSPWYMFAFGTRFTNTWNLPNVRGVVLRYSVEMDGMFDGSVLCVFIIGTPLQCD